MNSEGETKSSPNSTFSGVPDIFHESEKQKLSESQCTTSQESYCGKTKESGRDTRRRQLLILSVFSFTEFFVGTSISLQAPFYPAEAEKKSLSASEYGIVFGVFELTFFVVSLFYGKYMKAVGPKFGYNVGLLAMGVCSILFGMLDKIQDGTTFFVFSMVTRIMEAMACAACVNSGFVIIAIEFPNSIGTTFATIETIYSVGFAVGPVIGGALFQLGGFTLPFMSTGILLIFSSVLTFFVLPTQIDTDETNEDKRGMMDLLRIPEVTVVALGIFATALTTGHLLATLEPHIRVFGLSPILTGLVIIIGGATYAMSAPLWGWLCDHKAAFQLYMLIGSLIAIIGVLLIGPASFFPFDTILWVTCLGLALQGVGASGFMVPSFMQAIESASVHGFPDGVSTYSLISGLWSSCFSLGSFLGPTISGVLFDTVGFRDGTLFVIAIQSVLVIAIPVVIFRQRIKSRNRSGDVNENEPLLGSKKLNNKGL